jgi:hypothetical protein
MGLDLEQRFTALRVIGTLFKVLAWITLIVGILAAVGIIVVSLAGTGTLGAWLPGWELGPGSMLVAVIAGVVVLIVFLVYFLLLYAAGDTIYLFLSIEDSTRHTAYLLTQQARATNAYAPPPDDYRAPAEDT